MKILVTGDSIVKYVHNISLLNQSLAHVFFAPFPGAKIDDVRQKFPKIPERETFDIIFCHVGTNNLSGRIDDLAAEYSALFQTIRQHNPSCKVLMSAILPRKGGGYDSDEQSSRKNEQASMVNLSLMKLCSKNAGFLFFRKPNWQWSNLICRDGVHLNYAGTRFLADFIIEAVNYAMTTEIVSVWEMSSKPEHFPCLAETTVHACVQAEIPQTLQWSGCSLEETHSNFMEDAVAMTYADAVMMPASPKSVLHVRKDPCKQYTNAKRVEVARTTSLSTNICRNKKDVSDLKWHRVPIRNMKASMRQAVHTNDIHGGFRYSTTRKTVSITNEAGKKDAPNPISLDKKRINPGKIEHCHVSTTRNVPNHRTSFVSEKKDKSTRTVLEKDKLLVAINRGTWPRELAILPFFPHPISSSLCSLFKPYKICNYNTVNSKIYGLECLNIFIFDHSSFCLFR